MGVGEDRSRKAPIKSINCWLLLLEIVGNGGWGGEAKKAKGLKGCVGKEVTVGAIGGLNSRPETKIVHSFGIMLSINNMLVEGNDFCYCY